MSNSSEQEKKKRRKILIPIFCLLGAGAIAGAAVGIVKGCSKPQPQPVFDHFIVEADIDGTTEPWSSWFVEGQTSTSDFGEDVVLNLTAKDSRTMITQATAKLGSGGDEYWGKISKDGKNLTVTFNKEFFSGGIKENVIKVKLLVEKQVNIDFKLGGGVKFAKPNSSPKVNEKIECSYALAERTAEQISQKGSWVEADGRKVEQDGVIYDITNDSFWLDLSKLPNDVINVVVHLEIVDNPIRPNLGVYNSKGIVGYIINSPLYSSVIDMKYELDNEHNISLEDWQSGGTYVEIDGKPYPYQETGGIWTINLVERTMQITLPQDVPENAQVDIYMKSLEHTIEIESVVDNPDHFQNPAFEKESFILGQNFTFYWLLNEGYEIDKSDAKFTFFYITLEKLDESGKKIEIDPYAYLKFEPEASDPTRVKTTIEWNPLWEEWTIKKLEIHAGSIKTQG